MKYLSCILVSLFLLPGTLIGSSITPQSQGIDETYGFAKLASTPRSRIITGVLRTSPHTEAELQSAIQEETGNSLSLWDRKQYEFNVKSKKSEVIYVVVGIFAVKPARQSYLLDNVVVTLTKRTNGTVD